MDAFAWDERYVTGEESVDDEHRELVRIINKVAAAQANSVPRETVASLVPRLVQFAVTHFRHEEELMVSVGCDSRHVSAHKVIHQDFLEEVARMRDTPRGETDTEALLRFLTSWLAFHILSTDQSLARQVRRIQMGEHPAEAFESEEDLLSQVSPLAAALKSLYQVIAERNHALATLNRELESLVEQRTRALSLANAQLSADQEKLKKLLETLEATQDKLLESERKRSAARQQQLQSLLSQIVDGDPVPTLVIGADHRITHWNKACVLATGRSAEEMVGSNRQWEAFYDSERPIMADLIVSGALDENFARYYANKYRRSVLIPGAFEAEDFFPNFGEQGSWLYFTAAPLRDAEGKVIGAIETLQDVTERHKAESALREHQQHLERLVEQRTAQLAELNSQLAEDIKRREAAEAELQRRYDELQRLNSELSNAHQQLVQSEKMASIGQLAAGIAHEINNPIGFVQSNIGSLEKYLANILSVLAAYEEAESSLPEERREAIQSLRRSLELDYLKEDIPALLGESKDGIVRVRKIVQDLKDFSRVGNSRTWELADLHSGIDSALNIVANQIKYSADVVREYGALPEVECLPFELNQVFMNLLVNAAHAMREPRGRITIRTGVSGANVWLEFSDNGVGIPADIRQKVFDPFFTTKPVGQGTGLGLSLSYGIIQKHRGAIEVDSEVGLGTTFRITLPIRRAESAQETPQSD